MDRRLSSTSEEARAPPHKVPLLTDMQKLAVLRGQRLQEGRDGHATENHETESTDCTPLGSPTGALRGIVKEMTRETSDPESLTQQYRIRNLMTGEELDLRDENDESFPLRFAELVNRERQMNHQLWEAAEFNNVPMCKSLLDINKYKGYTAQVNSKGLNGWTALHVASSKGNVETCLLFLDPRFSADVNARTSTQRTPLHLAAIKGHEEVAEVLLAAGAGINIVDADGCSALHYASGFNYTEVVRVLLARNCDISLVNSINKTPYEMSCTQEMTQLFLNYQRNQGLDSLPTEPVVEIEAPILPKEPANSIALVVPQPLAISSDDFYSDFKPVFLIGKGSFGEVYLVVRVSTQELYALKLLKKEKVIKQKLTRYVMTERKILSAISHPFIVKLYYAFQTSDRLGMVLEYCPGGDLGYHLSREKRFPEERAKIYLCECLLALEALHGMNIVYRDLKPDNIVLDSEGHALITDFGLSKELPEIGSLTHSFCGSVAYLAPEVLTRRGHDMMVDWYLLGVLLYEMLVGVPPYFSCVREELFQNIQYAKLKFPMHVSGPARNLIKLLLERDPSKRLGARGANEIKSHQFFRGINWDSVYNRELKPPIPTPIRRKPDPNTTMETLLGRHRLLPSGDRLENWSFVAP